MKKVLNFLLMLIITLSASSLVSCENHVRRQNFDSIADSIYQAKVTPSFVSEKEFTCYIDSLIAVQDVYQMRMEQPDIFKECCTITLHKYGNLTIPLFLKEYYDDYDKVYSHFRQTCPPDYDTDSLKIDSIK